MKKQINLYYLKYFCDAALYNSISEASKINLVSQSAISQAIAKLEMILGKPLLIRSRHQFELTEEGKLIFEHASSIFNLTQDIQEKIIDGNNSLSGKVNFVTTTSLGMSYIAPSYLKMKETYPEVEILSQMGNLSFIRNALRQRTVEFTITLNQPEWSQFSKRVLKKGSFNLYQHKDANVDQLEKGVLIDFYNGLFIEDLQGYFLHEHTSPLKIKQTLSSWEVVARFTELNLGVGFFPDYLMIDNRYPNIKQCSVEIPNFEYELCAIYNKGDKLSRASSVFLDIFENEIA